jgi:RNA polymerase sigma-70 factor (ECF subfamily)
LKNITKILAGCINKEPYSQRLLYESYYGYALKLAFRYVYRYEAAVDVVNDSFVKVINSFHLFRIEDADAAEQFFMGWVKRIVVNTAIDALRKKQMTPEIGGIPDCVWDIADTSQDIEKLLRYKDIVILIKKLQPEYRAVFNMYVIDGYSHLEISEILNIPIGTSKSRLSRARDLLQESLKEIEQVKVCGI